MLVLRGPIIPSAVLFWRALHHLLLWLLLLLGLFKHFFDWLAEIARSPVPECLLLGGTFRSDLFLSLLCHRLSKWSLLGLLLPDFLVLFLLRLVEFLRPLVFSFAHLCPHSLRKRAVTAPVHKHPFRGSLGRHFFLLNFGKRRCFEGALLVGLHGAELKSFDFD